MAGIDFVPLPQQQQIQSGSKIDFQPIGGQNAEPAPAKSQVPSVFNYMLSPNLSKASLMDPLADVARLGQSVNKNVEAGAQPVADMLHTKLGIPAPLAAIPTTAVDTASQFFMPTNRLSAGIMGLGPIMKAAGAVGNEVNGVGKLLGLGGTPEIDNAMAAAVPEKAGQLVLPKVTQAVDQVPIQAELRKLSDVVKNARLEGVAPTAVMTDAERALYAKHGTAIDNAIQHDVPIEAILPDATKGVTREVTQEVAPAGAGSAVKEVPAAGAIKPVTNKPGFLAQWVQANTRVSPRMAQYAIDHPGVMDSGPSVEEATKAYQEAVGGLKGKAQSIGQRLNKTLVDEGDYTDAINRAGRMMNGTLVEGGKPVIANPQDALEGVQTINQAMKDKIYTSKLSPEKMGPVMELKDKLLDYLENNGTPGIRKAGKDLYEAHIRDAFSDWLPRNKYGSTDSLKTTAGGLALAGAGGMALHGNPAAIPLAAGAAMASPKVMGGVLRNVAALPRAASMLTNAAVPASNAAGGQPQELPSASYWKAGNTINPGKSGAYGNSLTKIGLPSNMISGSGRNTLQQFADRYTGGDQDKAIEILRGLK